MADDQRVLLRTLLGEENLKLIDVGARGGIDERWDSYHGLLEACAFEPDPDECRKLNASAANSPYPIRYLPKAIGASDGAQATLNICKQPSCSSTLLPNFEFCNDYAYRENMQVDRTWPMTLHRLDTALNEYAIQPDVIKVDTQGTALDVMQGAGRLLDGTLVVELEVEFVAQYVGQAQFADIELFMRERGFVLRALKRSNWRRTARPGWPRSAHGGQLVHGDALYVNSKLLSLNGGLPRASMIKGLIALSAYRQDDLILDLLSRPHPALAQIGEPERRALAEMLTRRPPSGARKILSGVISAAGYSNRRARRWVDEMREPGATDWHDADFY